MAAPPTQTPLSPEEIQTLVKRFQSTQVITTAIAYARREGPFSAQALAARGLYWPKRRPS
jgi:hypothetical protein